MSNKLKDAVPLIRELYEVNELSLREIADRLEVSAQAVHYRLKAAGVVLRDRVLRSKVLDRKVLEELYVARRLPARAVAEQIECSATLVYTSLKSNGIPRRVGYPRKHPELETLKLGESIVVDRPTYRGKFQTSYYSMAKKLGIRLSVKRLDDKSVRLTRVG